MKQYMIPSVRFPDGNVRSSAQEGDMAILLKRKGHKWPAEGMGVTTVAGMEVPKKGETNVAAVEIWVWVEPSKPDTRQKSSAHRVKCHCPGCNKIFSVGRLRQHKCHGAA